MKYIDIGSLKDCSIISLGCMRMSQVTAERAKEVLEACNEVGINFFDHADIYGDGESEKIFGMALRASSLNREDIYIQTKCSIKPDQYDSSYDHILQSVEDSLERLQIDYLDALLLHRPDALIDSDEVNKAFSSLYQSGKVKNFGVSNYRKAQIELLQSGLDHKLIINQVQFSIAHTLLIDSSLNVNIDNEAAVARDGEILEYAQLNNITLQAWSPLQYGMIKGNFIENTDFEDTNTVLTKIAKKYGVSNACLAIAWILRHPATIQPIIGSMNPEHIRDISSASDIYLNRSEWYQLYTSTGKELP